MQVRFAGADRQSPACFDPSATEEVDDTAPRRDPTAPEEDNE